MIFSLNRKMKGIQQLVRGIRSLSIPAEERIKRISYGIATSTSKFTQIEARLLKFGYKGTEKKEDIFAEAAAQSADCDMDHPLFMRGITASNIFEHGSSTDGCIAAGKLVSQLLRTGRGHFCFFITII
jgi:hypothetical protein